MPAVAGSYPQTAYLTAQSHGMTPQQVLLQLYDHAIAG